MQVEPTRWSSAATEGPGRLESSGIENCVYALVRKHAPACTLRLCERRLSAGLSRHVTAAALSRLPLRAGATQPSLCLPAFGCQGLDALSLLPTIP